MLRQELLRPRMIDLVGRVFEDVVPAVGPGVDLGVREVPLPLGQEVAVEDEVPHPPQQQHRHVARTSAVTPRCHSRCRSRGRSASAGSSARTSAPRRGAPASRRASGTSRRTSGGSGLRVTHHFAAARQKAFCCRISHAPSRVLRPSHSDHGNRFAVGSGNAAGVRRDDAA